MGLGLLSLREDVANKMGCVHKLSITLQIKCSLHIVIIHQFETLIKNRKS